MLVIVGDYGFANGGGCGVKKDPIFSFLWRVQTKGGVSQVTDIKPRLLDLQSEIDLFAVEDYSVVEDSSRVLAARPKWVIGLFSLI